MFGERCYGHVNCGHTTNWSCPCTCDEEMMAERERPEEPSARVPPTNPIDLLARYLQHDVGCHANDFDYLDHTPCTCGLRALYNPKGAI